MTLPPDDVEVVQASSRLPRVQPVLPQESRDRHAVDRILADDAPLSVSSDLIGAGHDPHVVSLPLQIFRHLRAPQLVAALMVRRVEIADDQDFHVNDFSPIVC